MWVTTKSIAIVIAFDQHCQLVVTVLDLTLIPFARLYLPLTTGLFMFLCSYLCDQCWELTTLQCSRSQAQSGAAWSWCTRHGRAAQWWATSSPVNPDTHWGTRVKKSYHSELSRCSHRVLWTKTYTIQEQGAMIIHLSQERYSWQMISSGEVRHHHTNDSTVRQGTMAFCSDY